MEKIVSDFRDNLMLIALLVFSECQDLDGGIKTVQFSHNYPFRGVKFSVECFLEEVTVVVTDNFVFDKWKESVLRALFGFFRRSEYGTKDQNEDFFNGVFLQTSKFLIGIMMADIKPAVTENDEFESRPYSMFMKMWNVDQDSGEELLKNYLSVKISWTTLRHPIQTFFEEIDPVITDKNEKECEN